MTIVNNSAITLPVLLFLKLTGIMVVINFICEVAFIFFDSNLVQKLFFWNPILCGFVHSSPSHFFYNIVVLFLLLLPKINYLLGLKKIIGYTILISLICFPFVLLKISLPFVGISGLYYFLLTRYLLSITKYKLAIRILLGIFIFSELGLMGNDDTVSHLCHFVGFLTSLLVFFKKKINFTIIFKKIMPLKN